MIRRLILLMIVWISLVVPAGAVPAYPGLIETIQPDGTIIHIRLRGDEYFNWAVSSDGYTLVKDYEHFYTYAIENAEGRIVPSSWRYGLVNPTTLPKQKLVRKKPVAVDRLLQKNDDIGLDMTGTFPLNGRNKLLMLLVNFADTEITYTADDFEAYMNQPGYGGIGSFRDFYLENSYGALDIDTYVTRWITLPYSKAHYGNSNVSDIIYQALEAIDDEIDLNDFDNNKDGILDGLAIIHQGTGQEASGAYVDIWSHSATVTGIRFDGVEVRRYTIQPEVLQIGQNKQMSTIGVMCHEFAHNLGAPDYYDTDYEGSEGEFLGTGDWDLMASGIWNGESDSGNRPAHINMWQKLVFGWCTYTLLEQDIEVMGMRPAHVAGDAFRLNSSEKNDYFILENRQQKGAFDRGLPGHGLIVYHVDENAVSLSRLSNTVNVGPKQGLYTVCAASGCDPDGSVSSYGEVNSPMAPFPGTNSVVSFSDESLPSVKSRSGKNSYVRLQQITEESDGTISFLFSNDNAPEPPSDFKAVSSGEDLIVSWKAPQTPGIKMYRLFRSADLLAETTDLVYVDSDVSEGIHEYKIEAVYNDGRTSVYQYCIGAVAWNVVTAISSCQKAEGLQLQWTLDKELTRMNGTVDDDGIQVYSFMTDSIDLAHRFTAEELKPYVGYKIARISHFPIDKPSEVSFSIRVWRSKAGADAVPELVSERSVSEFGMLQWRDVMLKKNVLIEPGYDYWCGIHIVTKVSLIKVFLDKGPVSTGRGNLIKQGRGWSNAPVSANFMLKTTLTGGDSPVYVTNEEPPLSDDFDPELDWLFPIGFNIYRNGEYLGFTSTRNFVDSTPLSGETVYSITSLYHGPNESVPIELRVTPSSLKEELCSDCSIQVIENGIRISGLSHGKTVCIYDIQGQLVYMGVLSSDEIVDLPAGLYLLRLYDEQNEVLKKVLVN